MFLIHVVFYKMLLLWYILNIFGFDKFWFESLVLRPYDGLFDSRMCIFRIYVIFLIYEGYSFHIKLNFFFPSGRYLQDTPIGSKFVLLNNRKREELHLSLEKNRKPQRSQMEWSFPFLVSLLENHNPSFSGSGKLKIKTIYQLWRCASSLI